MTTVRDVARRAGVSIATVSRVFGRPDAVAAATRLRVLSAADELGYSPNTSARALVRGRTGYLGLLVHDLANPFYATVAKAAQLEARRRGLALFCADYGDQPADELALAKEMARHVDGLLLYPSQPAGGALGAAVADLGPAVLIDSPVEGVPHVVMSTAEGVDQAVDHLAALGHRGLTYVDAASATMFTWTRTPEHGVAFASNFLEHEVLQEELVDFASCACHYRLRLLLGGVHEEHLPTRIRTRAPGFDA